MSGDCLYTNKPRKISLLMQDTLLKITSMKQLLCSLSQLLNMSLGFYTV